MFIVNTFLLPFLFCIYSSLLGLFTIAYCLFGQIKTPYIGIFVYPNDPKFSDI